MWWRREVTTLIQDIGQNFLKPEICYHQKISLNQKIPKIENFMYHKKFPKIKKSAVSFHMSFHLSFCLSFTFNFNSSFLIMTSHLRVGGGGIQSF